MSMINDALKRAKNAQEKTRGTVPGPELRPAEPLPPSARRIGLIMPMFIILFVFMSFVFVWQTRQQVSATEPKAKLQPVTPTNSAPKMVAVVAPKPAAVAKPVLAVTNAPVIAIQPPPKLQAIFFVPGHSTAMVAGKTVKQGDVINNFRVASITQSSVTFFSRTQTNVVTLRQ